jgi:hypothetical protein
MAREGWLDAMRLPHDAVEMIKSFLFESSAWRESWRVAGYWKCETSGTL